MIMSEGYWRESDAAGPLRGAGRLLGSVRLLLRRGGGGRIERQRERVDAVPLAGWAGTVVEHMAEVASAPAAAHLRAPHQQAVVRAQLDRLRDSGLGEARPARSRVELCVGAEQHRSAGRTAIVTRLLVVDILALKRRLGTGLAEDLVLGGSQLLAPLLLRL